MDPTTAGANRRPRRSTAVLRPPIYDESEHDAAILDHIGHVTTASAADKKTKTKKRKKTLTLESLQKETHTEALIALSLGFPIDSLLPGETLTPNFSLNDYVVVRNHILSLWRRHCRSPLPLPSLLETISSRYDPLVSSAFSFLSLHGFINFGILRRTPVDPTPNSVLVIGAGLAGLSAARQLIQFGIKVAVLEGKTRPGGRVYTYKLGSSAVAELGGSVVTGTHANPLAVLARQLGAPLHKIRDRCPLFRPDGGALDGALDAAVASAFNALLDAASQLRDALGAPLAEGVSLGEAVGKLRKLYGVARSGAEREVFDWHLANLEYANAGCLSELSLAHWDQDDPYEMDGDHCFLAGGNWRLVNALCADVPILYGKKVVRIAYGNSGVEVTVESGQVFRADMVLCTVSLGVLKSGAVEFEPELPARKKEAIGRLGFGLLNKIAMLFPYVFWGEDLDTFGCLNEDSSRRGEFFLFYSYHAVSGGAVLVALVAGEAALEFERTDPVVLLHRVLGIIRGIFKPRNVEVPDPIQSICTKWGSDPLFRGSYSHVRVGSSGNDYDILAESVGGRLFFAGEATSRQYPATMQGAFLSGLREAASIFEASKNINPEKSLRKNSRQCEDALLDLFKAPDVSFGIFDFVFDPFAAEDLEAMGVMRVTFEKSKPLHFYVMLSREGMLEMQRVGQEDTSRLSNLCKKFGLNLMGFESACALGSSLIMSISASRRAWNRLQRSTHYKL